MAPKSCCLAVVAVAALIVSRVDAVPARPTRAGTAWAIVVGIDEYQDPNIRPLHGAVKDARAIADALVRYVEVPRDHVSVIVSDGETKPRQRVIVEEIERISKVAKPEDLLVFFFAGHGIEVDGRRFLLTYETEMGANRASSVSLRTSSLPASELIEDLERVRARNRLVMIDACRDDPTKTWTGENTVTEADERLFRIRSVSDQGTRATFLSSSRGQSAYEWSEKQRGFFSHFVELGLSGAAGYTGDVTASSLLTYVNWSVPRAVRTYTVNKEQKPFHDFSGDDLVLVRGERMTTRPETADRPAARLRTLAGIAKDAHGKPIRDVAIRVRPISLVERKTTLIPAPGQAQPVTGIVKTDEDGFFQIDGIPSDVAVEVLAERDGYLVTNIADTGRKLSVVLARAASATATAPPTVLPPVATRPIPASSAAGKPGVPSSRGLTASSRAEELALVADQNFAAEQFAEAEEWAREALQADPDHALANAVAGNALAFAVATDLFNTADPRSPSPALLESAREARAFAERAIRSDPRLALAQNARGLVYLIDGDERNAERAFKRARDLDRQLSVAHANLGELYLRQEKFRDAERAFRDAIAAQRANAIPYNGLAQALTKQRKYDAAIAASYDAIARHDLPDRNLGLMHVNLAIALHYKRETSRALEAVARARALGVDSHAYFKEIEEAAASRIRR